MLHTPYATHQYGVVAFSVGLSIAGWTATWTAPVALRSRVRAVSIAYTMSALGAFLLLLLLPWCSVVCDLILLMAGPF